MLDVFFLSNGESNADEHWQRLQKICPRAKRIDGVDGLFKAHQVCAQSSTTENFWVVDADAWVLEDFDFSYVPTDVKHWGHIEKNCTLIWPARNPVNGLIYGYGGVKMFPKKPFLDNPSWKIDLSTTISSVPILQKEVACITMFNATPESAWIGAFRECAKLSSLHAIKQRLKNFENNLYKDFEDIEQYLKEQVNWTREQRSNYRRTQHSLRLESTKDQRSIFTYWNEIEQNLERYRIWTTYGWSEKNGKYTVLGAQMGVKYGLKNSDDDKNMDKINDWSWLKNLYQEQNYD